MHSKIKADPQAKFRSPWDGQALLEIDVNNIVPNEFQPRRIFNPEKLQELAESIKEHGIIQPMVVTERDDGKYEILVGERRFRASKLAGLTKVPALVSPKINAEQKLEIALIENVQRAELNPIEEAKAYTRLQEEFKLTQREVGVRVGKSREAVANTMRLLSLPTEIQEAIAKQQISESQARLLLSVEDIPVQKQLFEDIIRNNLSVREVKIRVDAHKRTRQPIPTETPAPPDPEALALQKELEAMLGAPVKVERTDGRAKIVIQCFSAEELDGLLARLRGVREPQPKNILPQNLPPDAFTV